MKKRTAVLAIAAVVVVACAACVAYAWEPAIAPTAGPPPAADEGTVARGARIAALGDCMVCHTAKDGKPYAGGLPMNTPFGTLYSTNITPDPATGIGNWSLEAFTRALRRGVSRDGHLLYPAFPYVHFTKMTDADIESVYAYLMARTPVEATAPKNDLRFPLGFRPLVAGWNLLSRHPIGPQSEPGDADKSAEWLRGRYLVEGPGHCESCHTPLNALGAEKRAQRFAGGTIDGWDAPPLNALAQSPVPWTKEQLVAYLHTGLSAEHGAPAGPMRPVAEHLARVPQSDVEAIATYLLALPDNVAPAAQKTTDQQPDAAKASGGADQGRLLNGQALFNGACASCHGAGSAMTAVGGRPSLSQGTSVLSSSPRNAIRMILDGNGWDGSQAAQFMPGFAQTFTDEQIADVVAYLRAEYGRKPAWPALGDTVARIRKELPSTTTLEAPQK